MSGDVPTEWVAALDRALYEMGLGLRTKALQNAIAAIAPMIRAAEAEECARVAKAKAKEYRLNQSGARNPARWHHSAEAADEITAAIRARHAKEAG